MLANIIYTGCVILASIPKVTMLERRFKVIIQDRKTAISYIERLKTSHPTSGKSSQMDRKLAVSQMRDYVSLKEHRNTTESVTNLVSWQQFTNASSLLSTWLVYGSMKI